MNIIKKNRLLCRCRRRFLAITEACYGMPAQTTKIFRHNGRSEALRLLFFILLIFPAGPSAALAFSSQDAAQFTKANAAYREGMFDEAAALYKTLAGRYPGTPAFLYNLGNALHRKGERGTAILAYERARRVSPRNGDVLFNLNYVRSLLEYRIEDKRAWFVQVADRLLGYFTFRELAFFGFTCGLLFLGSWAGVLFLKQDTDWGVFRKTLLVLALSGAALVIVKGIQQNFFREAIVITKDAQAYYGPSVNDQQAFRLGDGLKVYLMDSREGWSRILIASGESGWIQSDQVTAI